MGINGAPRSGNLTKDDLQRYGYDAEGRQVKVRNLGDTADVAEYLLDGAGVRVKKCTPNCGSATATTVYAFALAEYDDGAAVTSPTREYILSGGALVATIEGSSTTYHHGDHLSRRVSTNTSGTLVSQQGHHPFGEQWYAKDGSGASVAPGKLFFTSYERDAESGNDYAVFRSHMNRVGRFTSPDPIAGSISDPQSLNRYAYVRNDPVNLTDPLGLDYTFLDPTLMRDYAGNCTIDRISVPCSLAYATIASGGAANYTTLMGSIVAATEITIRREWGWYVPEFGARPRLAFSISAFVSAWALLPFDDQGGPGSGGGEGGQGPGSDAQKKRDLIKAALKQKNLANCLNKFFGPGTILTNENLPRIDASKDLSGAGQTDPNQVPETGRATVQIDKGILTSLPANDPFLVGTYLHEVANALAIQRFTNVPRGQRSYRGPLGGLPTDAQRRSFDKDIGEQFEVCIFKKE